ncbi:hypothetical protein NLG97_g5578 [Lecanicillium saksenae]|uniref:Uncharacterized protein n=1 Tax=Lecanicillium saksenae TaxID=468837 RepID=A0ACC1QUM3_9HYPO|nr:hypothetical protein NLG97_g5578 [Lecanicillium saksenae]
MTRNIINRCTVAVPRCVPDLAQSGRRWTSHSRSSLTDEALLRKIEARLNDDKYGDKIKVDAKNKRIATQNGELPMSPLFDPNWIKSKRRQTKGRPRPAEGQFQRQLQQNPFARALATPIRYCAITKTQQPRYFLQRFDVVRHPETNEGWLAPSNDDYCHIQRRNEARAREASPQANVSEQEGSSGHPEQTPRVTGYVASQKSVLDAISGPKKKLRGALLAHRTGMAVNPDAKMPVWRHDMGEVVLQTLRREAVGELKQRAAVAENKFVQPCSRWEDIKDVGGRGCILWLPATNDASTARQHATFDVAGANYGGKLPVHNLNWLLGEEQLSRLRRESEVFRENELLVLKGWPTNSMIELHLLLWKLQGYLDEPSASPARFPSCFPACLARAKVTTKTFQQVTMTAIYVAKHARSRLLVDSPAIAKRRPLWDINVECAIWKETFLARLLDELRLDTKQPPHIWAEICDWRHLPRLTRLDIWSLASAHFINNQEKRSKIVETLAKAAAPEKKTGLLFFFLLSAMPGMIEENPELVQPENWARMKSWTGKTPEVELAVEAPPEEGEEAPESDPTA